MKKEKCKHKFKDGSTSVEDIKGSFYIKCVQCQEYFDMGDYPIIEKKPFRLSWGADYQGRVRFDD